MIIKEFRVVLPMTVEEYQVAQLYSVAQKSKQETGGGEGIEVLLNDPFTDTKGVQPLTPLLEGEFTTGQYTHKIYHLASKVPGWIRLLAPAGSLHIHETAWNSYPYCRTLITNPDYMKGCFKISIETIHLPDNGKTENAHKLKPELLKKRDVEIIDISQDHVDAKDYNASSDPSKISSKKTGRGPLGPGWMESSSPVMCCYKLVQIEFKWFGIQGRIEKFITGAEKRLFLSFHRDLFCWMDEWYGLTMEDIRELEKKTKEELDNQIKTGDIRGTRET